MKADMVMKEYVKDKRIFADIFNQYIYGGRQAIRAEQLTECGPMETALPYGIDGTEVPVWKLRDTQEMYTAMTDGKIEYVLYVAGTAEEIPYGMLVWNRLYSALKYAGQMQTAKPHQKEVKWRKEQGRTEPGGDKRIFGAGEALGSCQRENLMPSIMVTLFFGLEEWDGPLSLFDMMEVTDPHVLACMDNYHVRLIAPAGMSDGEIMKFQSSMREVMFFIKYSKDQENMARIVEANEKRFRGVERRAAEVACAATNLGMKFDESGENVDMCKVLQEIGKGERYLQNSSSHGKITVNKK